MPIKLKLDEMMADRGMNLTELAGKVGITLANLSIIKTNKGRALRFSTLDALCRELNCQPGDLLEFVDGSGRSSAKERMPAKSLTALKPMEASPRAGNAGLPGDYY